MPTPVRGKSDNSQIDKKDFRAYMEARLAEGGRRPKMNKIRASIVKFGALYGKWESFHALLKKLGEQIRELSRSGQLRALPGRTSRRRCAKPSSIDLAIWMSWRKPEPVSRRGLCAGA
jgi:hypothetical protein